MRRIILLMVVLFLSTLSLLAQSSLINVSRPSNNEILSGGTKLNITWSSVNVDGVKIEYSIDGGVTWSLIVSNYPASASKYEWTVPANYAGVGKIRLSDVDEVSTFSVGTFTIAYPQVELIDLDTEYTVGRIYALNWEYRSVVSVDLLYSLDYGTTYHVIKKALPASLKTYVWVPPVSNASRIHLLIRSSLDESILDSAVVYRDEQQYTELPIPDPVKYRGGSYDGHAAASSSQPFISFVAPVGEESFAAGASYNIIWKSNGVEQLQLHFSKDKGTTWSLVDSVLLASTSKVTWQIPNVSTINGLLRLRSAEDTTLSAVTATPIMIRGNSLVLNQNLDTSNTADYPILIGWKYNGVSSIRLQYRKAGTLQWITAKASLPAVMENFPWMPPSDLVNESVYLKIQSLNDTSLVDTSINAIAIRAKSVSENIHGAVKYWGGSFDGHASASTLPMKLQLLSPEAGAVLDGKSQATVFWKAQSVEKINLLYSTDSMQSWTLLVDALPANKQQYPFNVPGTATSNLFIKIINSDDSIISHVLGPIRISLRSGFLKLTGVSSTEGIFSQMYPIEWSDEEVGQVSLHYRGVNETNWKLIRHLVPAVLKSYIWAPSVQLNGAYYIRIADPANAQRMDSMQVNFAPVQSSTGAKYRGGSYDGHAMRTSNAKILVTKPLAGEVVVAGSKYLLTWNAQNVSDSVKIEYTTDNGLTWRTIQSAVDARAGQYEWDVPSGDTLLSNLSESKSRKSVFGIAGKATILGSMSTLDNCKVRVSESGRDADVEGFSNRTFTISESKAPLKAMVTVLGSTQLCAGDSVQLTASNGVRYEWSTGATVPAIWVNAPGAYSVKVIYQDSTSSISDTTRVTVMQLPVAVIQPSGTVSVFKEHSVTLKADSIGGYSYQWYRGTESIADGTFSYLTVSDSGTYKVKVMHNGCISHAAAVHVQVTEKLPADNFSIAVFDEICRSRNNGRIAIKAVVTANYTAVLKAGNGVNTKEFDKEVVFENLEAGTYELCIRNNRQSDSRCFTLIIKEPEDFSVHTFINAADRTISLAMSGAKTYTVSLNSSSVHTAERSITLPLQPGINQLAVSSDLGCQGMIQKTVNLEDALVVHPNPFQNLVQVYLPAQIQANAQISVTDMKGSVVLRQNVQPTSTPVTLNLQSLTPGVYMINVVSGKQKYYQKIIKQ